LVSVVVVVCQRLFCDREKVRKEEGEGFLLRESEMNLKKTEKKKKVAQWTDQCCRDDMSSLYEI
jgi:hypothetical protein